MNLKFVENNESIFFEQKLVDLYIRTNIYSPHPRLLVVVVDVPETNVKAKILKYP
jgi:hypothetical protein